ncbi:MAG: trimeric intracellular cation channel family protein [archaeon]|nr:trimeric intracellular cation channel family protein [archaeon]
MSTFLLVLDLGGTFVFGLSGAVAGVKHKLDIFGVIVLSFVAANTGGIIRDLLIGAIPPATITDWRYIVAGLLPGPITFYGYRPINRLSNPVLVFDAAGLGLFAVTGSLKALEYSINPLAAVFLGVLTGVGGGVTRDILVGEIPAVLRTDIYAVAALVGSTVVVVGYILGFAEIAAVLGAIICVVIRILAIRRHWKLPTARHA